MHCFIFLQLALTIANEILFGIYTAITCLYDHVDWEGKELLVDVIISLGVLTFILS